jgi:hypothetical protein
MDKEDEVIIEPVDTSDNLDVTGMPIEATSEVKVEKLERDEETEYEPEVTFAPKDDGKNILIIVAVLIGVFALIFAGAKVYTNLTGATVINIDDLHQQNIENKLDEEEGYMYNGFSFVKVDGLWWTEVQRYNTLVKIPLHFAPKELEYLEIEGKASLDFDKFTDIYIAIDPEVSNKYYGLAIAEFSMNIAKGINRNPIGACTKESEDCFDRPIVSCGDSNGRPIVELVRDNSTKTSIKADGVCIKITGSEIDLVHAIDRLLYKWYGVME